MKLMIRAFVVALVLTGAAASSHISASAQSNKTVLAKSSALPIPTCPPDDPTGCGNPLR